MNCRKVNSLLSAYMDSELPGVEQLQIREHLSCCAECNDEYASLLRTKRMLSSLAMRSPGHDLEHAILDRIAVDGGRDGAGDGGTFGRFVRANGMRAWWELAAYSEKLRLTAAVAVGSVALAAFVIAQTPSAVTHDGPTLAQLTPMRSRMTDAAASLRPDSAPVPGAVPAGVLVNYHNPTEYVPASRDRFGIAPVNLEEPR